MAYPHSITFEGLADETTLTTGNTPFTSFAGTTPKADTARAKGGTVSMRFDGANGTAASANLAEPDATDVYVRLYLYLTAQPSGSPLYFFATSGTTALDLRVNSSAQGTEGTIAIRTAGTARATSTTVMPLDQWVRFDIKIDGGVEYEVKIFTNPDSNTATETLSTTTSVSVDIDSTLYGKAVANALVLTGWIDSITAQTTPLSPVGGNQLATPTGFTFVKTTNTRELTASWNAVSGADHYEVEVQVWDGDSWEPFHTNTAVASSPYVIDDDPVGVNWSTLYRARVRAIP